MADGMSRATGDILDAAMPWVRRYGRALTKSQNIGDGLAMRARLAARRSIPALSAKAVRIALFRCMHEVWQSPSSSQMGLTAARARVAQITPGAREALLLRAIEHFSFADIAEILHVPETHTPALFEAALQEVAFRTSRRVLIAESDTLIAMELADCASDMGCIVTGVARTAMQVMDLIPDCTPDLIISASDLADQSPGASVLAYLQESGVTADLVITAAQPELLLAGIPDEPLHVIGQPALPGQVRLAVGQALILASA